MITKKSITCFAVTIFLLLLTSSCKEIEVTITKTYVVNPNWSEEDNSFEIYRMKLKDSTTIIDLRNPSDSELFHGLKKDSGFSYTANVNYNGEDYAKRKVYFNKDNGFIWRKPPNIDPQRNSEYKVIGALQQETWYLLAGLSKFKSLYYIYIDSLDNLHKYKVSTMTNY